MFHFLFSDGVTTAAAGPGKESNVQGSKHGEAQGEARGEGECLGLDKIWILELVVYRLTKESHDFEVDAAEQLAQANGTRGSECLDRYNLSTRSLPH